MQNRPRGFVIVVSGPSGSGKSTIVRGFLERRPAFRVCVSHTTRQPRTGETDGSEYHFVDRKRFMAMVGKGEMLEWAEVHGNLYGTSRAGVERIVSAGFGVILEIDVQGARSVKKLLRRDATTVFVIPEGFSCIENRLAGRNTETAEQRETRILNAREELTHVGWYEYVILNRSGSPEAAVSQLETVADAEAMRPRRAWKAYKNLFWRI